MTTFVLVLLLAAGQAPTSQQFKDQDTLDDEYRETLSLKAHGYAINETDLIAALQDRKAPEIRTFAVDMLLTLPRTATIVAALKQTFNDALLMDTHSREGRYREETIVRLARIMQGPLGDTTWQNNAVRVLPQMTDPYHQLELAQILVRAGRTEGWPIVRSAIAGNDSGRIFTALGDVEKFDGLPNPDGGQRIDIAGELHQLAATTPDTLTWPRFGSESSKQRIKDHIEAKAKQIDKAKEQKRQ